MTRDVYRQPDAADPVLDDATVLSVSRRHVPGAQRVVAVDESGGEARTYAVDSDRGDLILKTQRPHRVRPRTSLEKETAFLRHLAGVETTDAAEPLPVPRVFGYGREGALEYILMTRIPGVAAGRATLAGPARTAALRSLAGVLARVHCVPQERLRASGLFPGDVSAADFASRVESSFAAAVAALSRTGATWPGGASPDEAAAAAMQALPRGGSVPLAALHSNPGPTHTFVDAGSGAFTGLIDFGDAYVSHPAWDLLRWPEAADREALFQGYCQARGVRMDNAFQTTWRVLSVLTELQLAARRLERSGEVAARVSQTLAQL